jgi:hypothetical protein
MWTLHALCGALVLAAIVAMTIGRREDLSAHVALPFHRELHVNIQPARWWFSLRFEGDLIDGTLAAPHIFVIPAAIAIDLGICIMLRRRARAAATRTTIATTDTTMS